MDNFLATLEASPVWGRFTEFYYQDRYVEYLSTLSESFLLAALVDWLDTEGIYVCPIKSDNWFCNIEPGNKTTGINYYASRSEATKAGIVKAFSLLEKK